MNKRYGSQNISTGLEARLINSIQVILASKNSLNNVYMILKSYACFWLCPLSNRQPGRAFLASVAAEVS